MHKSPLCMGDEFSLVIQAREVDIQTVRTGDFEMSELSQLIQTKSTTQNGGLYRLIQLMNSALRSCLRFKRNRLRIDQLPPHLLQDVGIESEKLNASSFENNWISEIETMKKVK